MKIVKNREVYSVAEVNGLARQTLEGMSFWVEGEISSFRGLNTHYRYLYFDLKDPQSGYKLPCILEPEIFKVLEFELTDGLLVLALGNLSLYEKEAKFQMYVHQLEEFGEGLLAAALEQLKKKLEAKGYFEVAHKKPLPAFPVKIAVISSKVADAWFDFKRHSIDRFGAIEVQFFDVVVQGTNSASQIIGALKKADKMGFEAIVLLRGGGSLEDLASFNDERLADAIFDAKTCVVVGVGHERDVTIAQLVADVAASTPTDAAKIITFDFVNLEQKLIQYPERLARVFKMTVLTTSQNLDLVYHKLVIQKEKFLTLPRHLQFLNQSLSIGRDRIIEVNRKNLQIFLTVLKNRWHLIFTENVHNLKNLTEKLAILSPQNTLERGYSIVFDLKNQIIRNVSAVAIGANIRVKFAKGNVLSRVYKKEK